ncbi:MAG: PilZ domain-containing protein [Cognaticolwellia sp.]
MSDSGSMRDEQADERRQSFRIDMEKELVDIMWTDSHGAQQRKKIACLDFSRGGLKVDCDCEIAAESQVTVIFKADNAESQKLFCKVLRCVKQDNGWFQVAMQLTDIV